MCLFSQKLEADAVTSVRMEGPRCPPFANEAVKLGGKKGLLVVNEYDIKK